MHDHILITYDNWGGKGSPHEEDCMSKFTLVTLDVNHSITDAFCLVGQID